MEIKVNKQKIYVYDQMFLNAVSNFFSGFCPFSFLSRSLLLSPPLQHFLRAPMCTISVFYCFKDSKLCRKVHCVQNQTCIVFMNSHTSGCSGNIHTGARFKFFVILLIVESDNKWRHIL